MASSSKSITDAAVKIIRNAPRVKFSHLKHNPGARTAGRQVSKVANKGGKGHMELSTAARPPLGWIYGDYYSPWQRRMPAEAFYNSDIHLRREYPPMSLLELQRLTDLGWFNVLEPIDLTTLCNTQRYRCDPQQRQFGVQLTDEGADAFSACMNIEVQWASELAIAAIERNGGSVTVAYYDPISLDAVVDPMKFFAKGEPIPKRAFPPQDILKRYTDPAQRGYLADPVKVEEARVELAQKYGYQLPETATDNPLMSMRKDPLQCFFGLEPGWVVNMADKTILKPLDDEIVDYYSS